MKTSVLLALVCSIFLALYSIPASAQATRTFVSGVGDDANPCSRTAPCKTFAGAISKTAAGGEMNCLDPGGFGALTITKSMAILCGTAGEAGVLVSGTNGIVISAATTDVVYLEGLDFEGLNSSLSGIQINTAAAVHIVNCRVRGFNTAGINVANSSGFMAVDVINSIVADNPGTAFGIWVKPTGSGSARLTVEHSQITGNGADGVAVNANVTTGSVKAAVRESELSNNVANGISVYSNSGVGLGLIDTTTVSNNGTGMAVVGSNATGYFSNSAFVANTAAVSGTTTNLLSYQTNAIAGNGSTGTFGTTAQQ